MNQSEASISKGVGGKELSANQKPVFFWREIRKGLSSFSIPCLAPTALGMVGLNVSSGRGKEQVESGWWAPSALVKNPREWV